MAAMLSKMQEKLVELSRRIQLAERLIGRDEANANAIAGQSLLEAHRRLASLYRSQQIITRYLARESNFGTSA
jgi:hypothetical protein